MIIANIQKAIAGRKWVLLSREFNLFIKTVISSFIIAMTIPILSLEAQAAERNFSIGSFVNIRIEGGLIINISTGKSPSAKVSGTIQQIDNISLQKNGRTLKVIAKKNSRKKRIKDLNIPPVEISLSARKLNDVFINGNGTVTIDSLKSKRSRFVVLGAGALNIREIQSGMATINIIGAGQINISEGEIQKSTIAINGSGSLNANNVRSKTLKIDHQGPANSIITVDGVANISNNGTGSIEILGNGNCIIKSIGSGIITCKKSQFPNR